MEIQELRISYCHNLRSFSDDVFSFKNSPDLKSLKVLFLYKLSKLSALIKVDEFGSATTSILAPSATFSYFKEIHLPKCFTMMLLLPHWLLPVGVKGSKQAKLFCLISKPRGLEKKLKQNFP
ncbi:hypothetical protein Gotur_016052 [Gossypium turneri]